MPKVQISPENKIYDGDGYLLRVACVCVRDNSENEVCVHDLLTPQLHCVAKVYAVLPFYDVKCLCSGGRE